MVLLWNFMCLKLFVCCYNRVRLRAIMRSVWAIALLGMSLLPLTADDPVEKRADPQAPTVSIQPRVRPSALMLAKPSWTAARIFASIPPWCWFPSR